MNGTIYCNHAGTSWPKPQAVLDAANAVLPMEPSEWPEVFAAAHRDVARFFHIETDRLLLTPSCTAALNIALMDHAWNKGDRVVSSHYEHHAVHRCLTKLGEQGVEVCILPGNADQLTDLDALEAELKSDKVRLVALTAACNVTGRLLPVSDAIELAHGYGALVLIDGAQVAGWWDLDLIELNVDMFTFAGHKGLQSPWGIGGLYVSPQVSMNCPLAVCDVAFSPDQPTCAAMPGYCDAGSVNLAALAGLAAGCQWLSHESRHGRLDRGRSMASEFANAAVQLPGIEIHDDVAADKKVPTVALSVAGQSSTDVASRLRREGIIVSGGFQCAPQAHRALGTDRDGVIRFSFGPTSRAEDVPRLLDALP